MSNRREVSITTDTYRILDHLILGRNFTYTEKDLLEGTGVSNRNLQLALPSLTKLHLIKTRTNREGKKTYQFNKEKGKTFLKFYDTTLKTAIEHVIKKNETQ